MGILDDISEPLGQGVEEAVGRCWERLGDPGRWWTGAERVAIGSIARAAVPPPNWNRPAHLDQLTDDSGDPVSPFVVAVTERVAVGASTLTRELVGRITERLGDARYVELVAVVAQVVAVDQLRAALGAPALPFPEPHDGEPSRERPDGMADVGGHVEMRIESFGPNVARSLSLAAEDSDRWLGLVLAMYTGEGFTQMVWTDRALIRPQVEYLAARTSALNECFY